MKNTSSKDFNQRMAHPAIHFWAVVGPTASGKTDLAIALAEHLHCEILCVDAMQVYKCMDIGSAKPTPHERHRVVHHGLDLVSPLEPFNASRFAAYAEPLLKSTMRSNKNLILCGGTGLYYRALLEGFFTLPDPDPALRKMYQNRCRQEGIEALYDDLNGRDPETAQTIHPHDVRRVIRALEIISQTGTRVSTLKKRQRPKKWLSHTCFIGIQRDRDELDERIALRTRWMYEKGLIDETKKLLQLGCNAGHTALQALGYKECFDYLRGKISRETALQTTQKETRRYARRQMTWFTHQCPTRWIPVNNETDLCQTVHESLQLFKNSDNNIQLRESRVL